MVTWDTNLPATRRVLYGNVSNPILGTDINYGYPDSTDLVSTPLLTQHGMAIAIDQTKTYYFRPVSSDSDTTVTGTELILSPTTTSGGSIVTTTTTTPTNNSCYYLYDYLRKDFNNNPVEVKKLQVFLKTLEGFSNLQVTGIYDDATIAAVDAFQVRYANDILTPWGYDGTTGTDYTYILTKKKVNEIYCQEAFPVNPQQQAEISANKAFFDELRNEGIDVNTETGNPPPQNTTPLLNNIVGEDSSTGNYLPIAYVSSTTSNFGSGLVANVNSSGVGFRNLALALFSWPFGFNFSSVQWCVSGSGWFIWLLILIIIIISALWYREHVNNKKIEDINKEIDLEK